MGSFVIPDRCPWLDPDSCGVRAPAGIWVRVCSLCLSRERLAFRGEWN